MAKQRIAKKVVQVVRQYSERLEKEEKLPIERVIVFGSQASGKAHRWSDIDVCIISPKFKNPLGAIIFLLNKRNSEEVKAGLEPVGFTRRDFGSGGSFIQEIKRSGVELY